MSELREFLDKTDPRVLWAGIVLGVVLAVYLLIWAPLLDSRNTWRERVEQRRQDVVWMQQSVATVRAGQSRQRRAAGGASQSLVDRIMKSQRVTVNRFEPGRDKGLRLRIESAPYPSILRSLHGLQQNGLVIDELIVQKQDKPGLVSASLTLR